MTHPNPNSDDRNYEPNSADEGQAGYTFMRGDQFLMRSEISRLERIFRSPAAPEVDLPPGC